MMQELHGYSGPSGRRVARKEDPSAGEGTEEHQGGQEGVRLQGRVELRDLTFGYNPVSPPLIENLNLAHRAGPASGVRGPSRLGKIHHRKNDLRAVRTLER